MRPDRLITLGLVAPFRRGWDRFRARNPYSLPPALPILMYHSISDDPEPGVSPYYRVCTSPPRFAEHMQWLADWGYRGVTLSEGLAWLEGREPSAGGQKSGRTDAGEFGAAARRQAGSMPVALTFDDGFRDFHTEAFPVLRRHGFSATIYLPTAFIADEPCTFKGRPCLTWGEVRDLQNAGVEFGSHTVNHPQLAEQPWPEVEREIAGSKESLDRRLDRAATAFSYPYAFPQEDRAFTTRLRELLGRHGFGSCVTTALGRAVPGGDVLALPRLPANDADDAALLRAKLRGDYDWMAAPQRAFKTLKRRRSRGEESEG